MQSMTMAQAKSDFERGLIKGVAIYFCDLLGDQYYTVSVESALSLESSCVLVDFKTKKVRQFKTMDAAHSAIRQIGFKPVRFWVSAQ